MRQSSLLGSLPQPDADSIRRAALENGKRYEQGDGIVSFPATVIGALASRAASG